MNPEKAILEILKDNAKITPKEIAVQLSIDEKTVQEIISSLENRKIIIKYKTLINYDKIDSERITALIEVKITPQRGHGFDKVAERIYRFKEITSVYLLSGSYDLLVMIEGHSLKEVAQFVSEKLSTMEHVLGTVTHFMLKKYKVDGDILEETPGDDRLPVTP